MEKLSFQSSYKQLFSNEDDLVILSISGVINRLTIKELEKKIEECLQSTKFLLIECSKIKYINSTGIGILVKFADKFQKNGGDIRFYNLPTKLEVLFNILGVASLLQVHQNEEQAIKSLQNRCADNNFPSILNLNTANISSQQAQQLKNIVHTKGKKHQEIMKIWSDFKRHFGLKKYRDLPLSQFQKGVIWLSNL